MLFNVYLRDDQAMVVAPRFVPQPAHLANSADFRHAGFVEVAFGELSAALASSIADRGYGDAVDAEEARLRASMWKRPAG